MQASLWLRTFNGDLRIVGNPTQQGWLRHLGDDAPAGVGVGDG